MLFFRTVLLLKAVRKIKKIKIQTSHPPKFSQNFDENLKNYLVWPYAAPVKSSMVTLHYFINNYCHSINLIDWCRFIPIKRPIVLYNHTRHVSIHRILLALCCTRKSSMVSLHYFIHNFRHNIKLIWSRFICIKRPIVLYNHTRHISIHRIFDYLLNI